MLADREGVEGGREGGGGEREGGEEREGLTSDDDGHVEHPFGLQRII